MKGKRNQIIVIIKLFDILISISQVATSLANSAQTANQKEEKIDVSKLVREELKRRNQLKKVVVAVELSDTNNYAMVANITYDENCESTVLEGLQVKTTRCT